MKWMWTKRSGGSLTCWVGREHRSDNDQGDLRCTRRSYSHWNIISLKKQNRRQSQVLQQPPARSCLPVMLFSPPENWLSISTVFWATSSRFYRNQMAIQCTDSIHLVKSNGRREELTEGSGRHCPHEIYTLFWKYEGKNNIQKLLKPLIQTNTMEHYSCHKGLFNRRQWGSRNQQTQGLKVFKGAKLNSEWCLMKASCCGVHTSSLWAEIFMWAEVTVHTWALVSYKDKAKSYHSFKQVLLQEVTLGEVLPATAAK